MKAKCFSFYSYKGGSGRTTALLNTAKHLATLLGASKDKPILLVDADLESAGLTYFFNYETKFTGRFKATMHTAKFFNEANTILKNYMTDNLFGESKEPTMSCEVFVDRISSLYGSYDIRKLLSGVELRQTTWEIFKEILEARERKSMLDKTGGTPDTKDVYLCKAYDFAILFAELGAIDSSERGAAIKKRAVIEKFLPTDGMADISRYFGLPEGSVKFIGADIASDTHLSITPKQAKSNYDLIATSYGKRGYAAILYDCSAGTQSTADVLNRLSDVLVYCMRPTSQFVLGTSQHIERYRDQLQKIVDVKLEKAKDRGETGCDKKSVILLPTAVPYYKGAVDKFQKDSFERIGRIANRVYSSFVDNTFCSYEKCLNEVELFKWREHILGTVFVPPEKFGARVSDEIISAIEPYSSYETMPDDAKNAYNVYKHLAERLLYNA